MPISNKLLKFEINNAESKLRIRQSRQKFYYDRTAQLLKDLRPDDNIELFNFRSGQWDKKHYLKAGFLKRYLSVQKKQQDYIIAKAQTV